MRSFSTPEFWSGRTVWQPWVLLCGGLILTLTLVVYRISLAMRAEAVERTVSARMDAFCKDAERRAKE